MKNLIFLSISVLILFSCTNNQPAQLTEEQKAAIEQEVRSLFKKSTSYISQSDMDILSDFWSKTDVIGIISDYQYFDSFNQYKDTITNWYSTIESQSVKTKLVNVDVLSENLVLIAGINNQDITFKDGNKSNDDFLFTLLWKKEDDGWKIIFYHESWK